MAQFQVVQDDVVGPGLAVAHNDQGPSGQPGIGLLECQGVFPRQ